MRYFLTILFGILCSILPATLFAQTTDSRSYDYTSIDFVFRVNTNASVETLEKQTYRFVGEYHQGWRSIPLRGTDGIEVVGVRDITSGESYTEVDEEQDKTDPKSWGTYTTTRSDGNLNIIWYFDAKDENRVFELQYRLLGAITFMDEHDEFYWNLFTDFTVPIERVSATVVLPTPSATARLRHTIYALPASILVSSTEVDARTIRFMAENIPPGGIVTIAPGWAKSVVDQGAYIRQTMLRLSPFVLALLTFLGTIVYSIWYWYTHEGKWKRHETIIPMYEPPQQLPPAMMNYIIKEHLAAAAWPATVVNLAVRGFLSIEEKVHTGFFGWSKTTDYVIKKEKAFDETLTTFEKDFIDALFMGGTEFSTREMKTSITKGRVLHARMQEIEKAFLTEIEERTGAYDVTPATERKSQWAIVILILVVFLGIPILGALTSITAVGVVVFLGTVLVCIGIVYLVRHDSRLNETGRALRGDCLGFKMYLETAERLRLQNLTPKTFEKFLPYAMIFGIEKKWAKAFANVSIPPPDWYHGSSGAFALGSGVGGQGGFSPTAFTSGFSASFSSAFASSGGSGASGGGGSAGGGGGGGGGGAS